MRIAIEKILKGLFSRITLVIIGLAIQFFWFFFLIVFLKNRFPFLDWIMFAAEILTVLWIINRRMDNGYKLIWILMILIVPIVGFIFYFLMGKSSEAKKLNRSMRVVEEQSRKLVTQNPLVAERLCTQSKRAYGESRYISEGAFWPSYQNTETRYFGSGEEWFECFIEEIKKAEHYIFMEYFIIQEGYMWGKVVDILKEKAAAGVDVRLIYDGIGTMACLPNKYYLRMRELGIKCYCYQPFRPFLNIIQNNRDHRKITVIDGKTAFAGGLNFSDEYINKVERFGKWKDSGLCIKGAAVRSLSVMFLQMWAVVSKTKVDIEPYLLEYEECSSYKTNGFVQPYGDSPLDDEYTGENVYLNMIGNARDYLYIFSPYLSLDQQLMSALCNCSKRGVDVRIVVPAIPDKKYVYLLTRSYFAQLIEAGVRIYEYTPGFIHSKSFVCDDKYAVVGTINLDYRSLYLHYECGVWLYDNSCVADVKKDCLETFEMSREVMLEDCGVRSIAKGFFQAFLRVIAPIL